MKSNESVVGSEFYVPAPMYACLRSKEEAALVLSVIVVVGGFHLSLPYGAFLRFFYFLRANSTRQLATIHTYCAACGIHSWGTVNTKKATAVISDVGYTIQTRSTPILSIVTENMKI